MICNDARYFANENDDISVIIINEDTIKEWIGSSKNIFRTKIKCLQYYFQINSGNVLFVDTDTMFIKNISQIFDKISIGDFVFYSIICTMEDYIDVADEEEIAVWNLLLNGIEIDGEIFKVDSSFKYCNSGVIGMNYKYAELLDKVDRLHECINEIIYYPCAEEIAFSVIFSHEGVIHYLFDYIFHYAGNNMEFSRLFVGNLLNCLNAGDKLALENLIEARMLVDLAEYDLTYENLRYFCYFIEMIDDDKTDPLRRVVTTNKSKYADFFIKHMTHYRHFLKVRNQLIKR